MRPSDRTKSDEEIAVEKREKLDQLEKERLKRMKSTYQLHSLTTSAAAGGLSGTGHSSHRGGGVSGGRERDEEEMDEYESSRSRKGKGGRGGKSRRTAPLTDDDMVDGMEEGDYDDDEEEEEDDEEGDLYDDDDEIDEEEEDGEAGEPNDEEEDEYGDGADEDEPEYELDNDQADEAEADDEYDTLPLPLKPLPKTAKAPSQASTEQDHIPHKIDCPTDYTQFNELLSTLAHSSDDITTIINRILIYNSVHLPGALGKGNRELMHNFLEMLFKHFIRVADSLAQVTSCEDIAHVEKQVCYTTLHTYYCYTIHVCTCYYHAILY